MTLVSDDLIVLGTDLGGGPELPREIKYISGYPPITIAMQKLGYTEKPKKQILKEPVLEAFLQKIP